MHTLNRTQTINPITMTYYVDLSQKILGGQTKKKMLVCWAITGDQSK